MNEDYRNCSENGNMQYTRVLLDQPLDRSNHHQFVNTTCGPCHSTTGTSTEKNTLVPEPSIETIKAALITLYQSNDNDSRNNAQNWLMKFQTLPIAWDFCPQLIVNNDIYELQYFGASTLERKLKTDWKALPKEMKAKILQMVVEIVQKSTKLSKCVVTRICLALSIIVMYTYPDVWKNAVVDVIQLSCPDINSLSILPEMAEGNKYDFNRLFTVLEFLNILPYELKQQDISASHRQLEGEVKKIIDLIYHYLLAILLLPTPKYGEEVKQAFNSIANWIKYLLPSPGILKQVFHSCFKLAMSNPTEFLENLVKVLEGSTCTLDKQVSHSPNSREAEEAYRFAVESSLAMIPIYYKEALDSDNIPRAKAVFNLFVQYLMCSNENIFGKDVLTKHLDLMIQFIQIGDIEVNALLFPLLEEMSSLKTLHQNIGKEILKLFLVKVFDRFLELSMLPMDFGPNDREEDELKYFRYNTAEHFSNLSKGSLLSRTTLVCHLITKLEESINSNIQVWQVYEAIVYHISHFSDTFNSTSDFHSNGNGNGHSSTNTNNEIISRLLGLVPRIPIKTIQLSRSTIKLVSKYPNYLRDKPEYLEKVIFDLIPTFSDSDLLMSSGQSFSRICQDIYCSQHLLKHLSRLIDTAQPALKSQQYNPSIILVYEGILRIASNVNAPADLSIIFEKLISPVIMNLNQILQTNNPQRDKNFLAIQLNILAAVSRIIDETDGSIFEKGKSNDPPRDVGFNQTTNAATPGRKPRLSQEQIAKMPAHPLYSFLKVVIPLFGGIMISYQNDSEVIDLVFQCYRNLIMYSKNIIAYEFLIAILQQANLAFSTSPLIQILGVYQSIVSIGQLDPEEENAVKESLCHVVRVCLHIFKQGVGLIPQSPTALHYINKFMDPIDPQYRINFCMNPDLAIQLFMLLSFCYRRYPSILDPEIVNAMVVYIIYNLLDVNQPTATRNSWTLLSTMITSNKSTVEYVKNTLTPIIDQTITQHAGKVLSRHLLIGMTSIVPPTLLQSLADVSLAFCSSYPKLFRQEASKLLLENKEFPNESVALGDKQKFLSELQRVNDSVEYRYSIRTFSILCGNNQRI